MKRLFPVCALILSAGIAAADQQMIPPGATMTPAQVGHAFGHGCFASQPALIEKNAELFQTAFFFEPADLGGDAGYVSADGAISVLVDGNPLETKCEMSVVADLAGDGSELYEALDAHLPKAAHDVEAQAVDGGLAWEWDRSGVSFRTEFIEVEGAFLLTFTAER